MTFDEFAVQHAGKTPERIARLWNLEQNRFPDVCVVCENIDDPHNVAAIMRSCDAFGVGRVDVIGDARNIEKFKKSSSSANNWVKVRYHESLESCLQSIRQEGKRLVVTHLSANSQLYSNFDWTLPTALVVGNEHGGVSEAMLNGADAVVSIPMRGMIQSLNVSVATAVLLAKMAEQRSKILSG